VKSRLLNNDDVGANHVKVVTNNDTVYLMGLVTRAEAAAATQTAATTSGVQRVVKVFEYLD
jgi:osmotically-inducible protein OsmY